MTIAHPIPAAALDQPLCIVGTVGSGKTYAGKSAVEGLLAEGRRVLIIDPTGVWWGLRTRADGTPGFPVVIFGGEHADVPVSPDAGDALGRLLAEDRVAQAIVDVSEMSGGERTRFLTALLERLYAGRRVPRHLVLDEADEMAPQDPLPETRRLQGIVDKIVRRGRVRGFRPMMITQRPAVLHKNVLSQIATLVALRLTSPQDRKAVEGWVKGSGDLDAAKAVLASLPSLAVGEGWVWAPREDVLERVRFPAIGTLDTSASPEDGATPAAAGPMAAVDVAAIRAALSATASADTEKRSNSAPSQHAQSSSAADLAAAEQRGFERGLAEGESRGEARGIAIGIQRAQQAVLALRIDEREAKAAPESRQHREKPAPAPLLSRATPARAADGAALTGPQRQLLGAILWWDAIGITNPSRAQVAAIAGWRVSSGHLKNVAGACRSGGLISYPAEGLLALTDAGHAAAPEPAGPGALLDRVRDVLTGPQRQVIDVLLNHLGRPVARDEIARALGWEPTSGHLKNVVGSLRTLELVDYPAAGTVRAVSWLIQERRS